MVLMRFRESREQSLPYKSKVLVILEESIQRLVLIRPGEQVKNELDNITPPLQAAHALNSVLNISYFPHPDGASLSYTKQDTSESSALFPRSLILMHLYFQAVHFAADSLETI